MAVLFIGVIVGIQEANDGLNKMKGYEDPRFKGILTVNQNEHGEYEATVFGQTVDRHDLEEKKRKLEEMKTYNFFSDIGKKFSTFVSDFVSSIISLWKDE